MHTAELLDCGHVASPHSEFTTGYGTDSEGKRHCYDCCHQHDLDGIAKAEPFLGYLTKDKQGKWIVSNWPGYALLTVRDKWYSGLVSGCRVYSVRATDAQGRSWYGKGQGEGVYIRMRPTKATKAAALLDAAAEEQVAEDEQTYQREIAIR